MALQPIEPAAAGGNAPPAADAPPVEGALWTIANIPGARVFPLRDYDDPNPKHRKAPRVKGWQDLATDDPDQIRQWAERWPKAGFGLVNVVCVDVDVKNGAPGPASFRALLAELGLAASDFATAIPVRTPSGGYHLLFAHPAGDPVPSITGFRPGVDIKAGGSGLAVCPGSRALVSVTDAGGQTRQEIRSYRAGAIAGKVGCPPARLVAAIRAAKGAGAAKPRAERDAVAPGAAIDDPDMILQATEWLLEVAPPAVDGDGGDITTFRVACELRDLGLSKDLAFELMAEHYNPRCSPPWDLDGPDSLGAKVDSAWSSAQNPIGAKHPEALAVAANAEFEGVQVSSLRRPGKWRWRHGDPIDLDTPWLYFERVPRNGTSIIVGPSNGGKSFLAAYMAECTATGAEFFGVAPDECCGVAILAAEGVSRTPHRLSVLGEAGQELPIYFDCVANLRSPGEQARVRELLADARADCSEHFGRRLGLVFIDTLASCGLLEDENNNSECSQAIKFLESLAAEFDCHVCVTHHPPKSGNGGPRGGSALYAGVDLVVEVDWPDKGAVRHVECTKGRDAPTGKWGSFTLPPRSLGLDSRGRENTTCTVSPSTEVAGAAVVLPPDMIVAIQEAIGDRQWRRDQTARTDRAHDPVGQATGLDPGNKAALRQIERYVAACISGGWLKTITGEDKARHKKKFVVVGEPFAIAAPAIP